MNEIELDSLAPKKARVEIIPLIDVVFFLLATFVLFTLSLSKIGAITMPLPVGHEKNAEDATLYLQASDAGAFYWKLGRMASAELITEREIAPRLQEYKRQTPAPKVFIRGDGKAKFGPAVMLIDEVRRAGTTNVSLETVVGATGS